MKRLLLFLLVLAALTTSAALADFTSLTAPSASITTVSTSATDAGWRRTRLGWEHERSWQHTDPFAAAPITHLHPAIIATLQLLTTLGALVWFEK
jgi:opacity protein-like surface antigen